MNFYKITLLLFGGILLLGGCTNSKSASTDNNKSTEKVDFLPELTKAVVEDLGDTEMLLDGETIPIYLPDGKRIQGMEMMTVLMSGNYSPEPYVNNKNEIKAYVLRELTDEEIEESEALHAAMDEMHEKSPLIGKKAPSFDVTDIHGNAYSSDNLQGKIVVLNFWFIACKPCLIEIPELNKLVEKYSNQEVVFLAFTFDKKVALENFLQKQNFDYKIIPNSKEIINQYDVSSFPTHIIIDKTSTIDFVLSGLTPTTIEQIDNKLETLLQQE